MLRKNSLILIIAILLSLQIVCAQSSPTASFPKTVTLVNTPVSVTLYIHNSSSTDQNYSLTAYTSPYESSFSENIITVNPNSSKEVKLTINPQENVLASTYKSSIELKYSLNSKKIDFDIIQKANRECPIDLQYTVVYVKDTNNYRLDLFFKNSSTKNEELDVIGLTDINLEYSIGKIVIESASESSIVRLFKTDLKETRLEYRCNGVYGSVNIDLPKKEQDKPMPKITTAFTGLISFAKGINLTTIINSVVFQVILVFILIVLILSFSTKYIKYVYRK